MIGKYTASKLGPEKAKSLGAFGGVFVPSLLTIVGIIFYLRVGYLVGEVGLLNILVIITISYSVSILTALSLCVLATSMMVKGGGFYYVISRILGFELGGALGIILFLSVTLGIAFYSIGLAEVVVGLEGVPDWVQPRFVAATLIVVLLVFAWAGADVATKLQYVVLALVAISVLAIGVGGAIAFNSEIASKNLGKLFVTSDERSGFWAAFALFFPAITGFTQGLNMSGDLRSPARDIPLGTITAVVLSYFLYIGLAIIIAGFASGAALRTDYLILQSVVPYAWIVTVGVLSATVSSAMASFLGAPRIVQAVGRDGVLPFSEFFAKGSGASDNPRRAVFLSGGIALAAVLVGDLNFSCTDNHDVLFIGLWALELRNIFRRGGG